MSVMGLKRSRLYLLLLSWEEFLEIAEKSPARELAEELKAQPFEQVALQLFAVYEKQ